MSIQDRPDKHTEVVYRDFRYVAPKSEIRVLPLNNISAENLAAYIGRALRKRLEVDVGRPPIERLRLAVSETSGQWGVYSHSC